MPDSIWSMHQNTGTIIDSLTNASEASTIVQFYKLDDNTKPVAYTTTDESGKFSHNLSEPGSYRLLLDNLVNSSSTGINTYISWNPVQKTRISFNGTASYNYIKSKSANMDMRGWLYNFMADIQQILPADYIFNFSISYLPNVLTLQSKTNGIWNSMLSISKSYFKQKLNINLTSITNLNRNMRASMKTVTEGKDFISTNNILMPWKDVILNITYSFGGKNYIDV